MKRRSLLKGISVVMVIAMVFLSLPLGGICVFAESIEGEIIEDVPVEVTDRGDDTSVLYFVPEETAVYNIMLESSEGRSLYGHICDEYGYMLDGTTELYWGASMIIYRLEAGKTYAIYSEVGEHELGSDGTYTVTVGRSDIASVTFTDTFAIDGYDSYCDSEYNEETDSYDLEWEVYDYYPAIVVTYTNGEEAYFEDGYYFDSSTYSCFYPLLVDSQSYYEQWETGNTYSATASLFGFSETIEVDVIEAPVERIEIEAETFVDGGYNSTDGEYVEDEYVEYPCFHLDPGYTVYFNDGSQLSAENSGDIVYYRNRSFGLSVWDDQSYHNRWGAGSHTAYASFMGVETTFTVEVVSTPITDIQAENIQMMVGTEGWENSSYDEYGNEVFWFCYDCSSDYTVTFADGSSQSFDRYDPLYIDGRPYWPSFESDQSYDNQWGPGAYTVTVSLFGVESTYTVEITASPIESVIIEDVSIIVETGGSYTEDYDEFDNLHSWYRYEYAPDYTVVYTDGTEETFGYYEGVEIGGEYYYLSIQDDQSYDNQWGIGVHTATASLMGVETTFNVEITASPVVAVTVEDISIIEGTEGYYSEQHDSMGIRSNWFRYDYNPGCTVLLSDGTTISANIWEGVIIDGNNYDIHMSDDQSVDSPWKTGSHTVTATLMGVETTFNVEIVKSPIVAVYVETESLWEHTEGSYYEHYDENEGWQKLYEYYYDPDYTVVFKDGTTVSAADGDSVYYNGAEYLFDTFDTQSESSPWGVGTHTATAYIGGVKSTFKVEIVEAPIAGIVFKDIVLYEGFDGEEVGYYDYETDLWVSYFSYIYTPECTVLMNDGTVLCSENGRISYNGNTYRIQYEDDQSVHNRWGLGAHTVSASLFGIDCTFNVTVKENPYTKLEIEGENELFIKLTKNDGAVETFEVKVLEENGGDYGMVMGNLITDSRSFQATFAYYADENGDSSYDKDLTVTIGNLESNSIDNNSWFRAYQLSVLYELNINVYTRWTGGRFSRYDGVLTDENIDDVVCLAGWTLCDPGDSADWFVQDGMIYYLVDAEEVRAAVEEMFGIKNIDFTKCSMYNESDPSKLAFREMGYFGGDPADISLYYENGKWIYECVSQDKEYETLKIVMDTDGKIESMVINEGVDKAITSVTIESLPDKTVFTVGELADPTGLALKVVYNDGTSKTVTTDIVTEGFNSEAEGECTVRVYYQGFEAKYNVVIEKKTYIAGDVNGDGTVNAVDSNILKRIIAGNVNIGDGGVVKEAADVDGDGTVNAVDSNLLKRTLAGI